MYTTCSLLEHNVLAYLSVSSPSTANIRLAAKPWSLSTAMKSPMIVPEGSFSGMVRLRNVLLNRGGLSLTSNTTTVTNVSDERAGDPPSVAATCKKKYNTVATTQAIHIYIAESLVVL